MENWIKRVLLTTAAALCSLPHSLVFAQDVEQVIEPGLQRQPRQADAIDSENFEVGVYYGIISIEDFSSNDVYGVRAAYHITEDFFFEATYGESEGDLTSFEKLSGGSPLLSDEDRDYRYYDLSVGWNLLPGEVFILDDYAFNSSLYLIAGIGSTEFAGDSWFTVNIGAGFRLLLTDSIAWHIDVRDHIFDRDTFGSDETTHNIEINSGFTVFF
ncbi:MAG: outer membrane beta-barrel protein [Oceanicoccus sp.]|jgi:outer membrane beta-barrel protein